MNIVCKPISMIVVFDTEGNATTLRFQIIEEDERKTVNIDKVIKVQRSNYVAIPAIIYTCETVDEDIKKLYEVRYNIVEMKWDLYRM